MKELRYKNPLSGRMSWNEQDMDDKGSNGGYKLQQASQDWVHKRSRCLTDIEMREEKMG